MLTCPGAPVGETVIDFLRGAVEKYGSRDALLFKPAFRYQRWSYSRLWNESGQVATLLQRRDLTMGDQVILWGPNSPHWVLIFFGCIRAGVVLVPLDLRSAPDYVSRVISRTEPKLAFTSRLTPKDEVDLGVPEITFEELEAAIQGLPQPEHVDIAPDDLAEIMFTSGTTGDPKGRHAHAPKPDSEHRGYIPVHLLQPLEPAPVHPSSQSHVRADGRTVHRAVPWCQCHLPDQPPAHRSGADDA